MDDQSTPGGATPNRSVRQARAELVRVDAEGVLRPVGPVAWQRMQAREGAFRMLPSPKHVVFLRLTGEDGRRDAEDGAIVRLAGEITAPGTMCDVLALAGQSGWRGELIVLDAEHTRSIFFDQGNIVGAQTSAENERIGMILWRYGILDFDKHAQVMERVRQGVRFGQAAVDLGFLTRETLFVYIAKQLEEIIFPTFAIADGTYFFLDGFDESRLAARHTISATGLLMNGLTRLDEIRYFRQKIPAADFVPGRTEKGEPAADLRVTWAHIDGKNSIEDIGRHTGLGEFETTKHIYTLLQTKHAVLHPPRISGGAAAVVARANSALKLVHQRADAFGHGTALRDSLRHFLATKDGYGLLLEGGGPDETGAFDPALVVERATQSADGVDPETRLKSLLHEYAAFALFVAGGMLGAAQEASLSEEIRPILHEILPTG